MLNFILRSLSCLAVAGILIVSGFRTAEAQCPAPANLSSANAQPNSIDITWDCPCNIIFLEYGPPGFTPGTGGFPGGGTLEINVTSPFNITGLQPLTSYDVYIRNYCNGPFSPNVGPHTFLTSLDCGDASFVGCGSYMDYTVNATDPPGAWKIQGCAGSNNKDAQENLFLFTAPSNGQYSIYVYKLDGSVPSANYSMNLYYKEANTGCDIFGWDCITTLNASVNTFSPGSFTFGPLQAGQTYLILADGQTTNDYYSYSYRIDCPGVCSPPKLDNVTDVTPATAVINAPCNNCFGDLYVEYGPSLHTPGTMGAPGPNGTVFTNVTFPLALTGLAPETLYDVYARTDCGNPQGFSDNTSRITFITCSKVDGITTSMGGTEVCIGDNFTLYQSGGILTSSGSYKWYLGGCGGTLLGTGDSLSLHLQDTTTIYMRTESNCGFSDCKSITINVVPSPGNTISPPGPVSLCAGNSIVLSAPPGTGQTYQWYLNNNPIAGATGSGYTASTPGDYTVATTNACATVLSAPVTVIINSSAPAAPAFISGDTLVCADATGITYMADPVPGAAFYNWILPSGASGFSQTNVITVNFNFFLGGPICVQAVSNCGSSAFTCMSIAALSSTFPPVPMGPSTVCVNDFAVLYTIPPVPGATSYIWSLPPGASGTSSTNAITLNFFGFQGGFLCVQAVSPCGVSDSSCLVLSATQLPAPPATITGPSLVCSNQQGVVYTAATDPFATSYQWSLPAGASGSSLTNVITVNFSNFTGGAIGVSALNACGSSGLNSMAISSGVGLPAPSPINGPTTVCPTQNGVVFSVVTDPNATSYQWVLPPGAFGGSNTNSITVNFSGYTGGNICVTATGSCGSSPSTCKVVNGYSIPPAPASVSGNTSPCSGDQNVPYSCATVAGATTYNWTAPSNASIASGQGTSSITVNFSGSFSSGNLSVTAANCAGTGPAQTLVLTGGAPATPGPISGPLTYCANQQGLAYSIQPVPGAISYIWDVPSKWSIASGQGTTNVTVNTHKQKKGWISVQAISSCGESGYSSLSLQKTCRLAGPERGAPMFTTVYPNPSHGNFIFDFGNDGGLEVVIRVYDVFGKMVHEDKTTGEQYVFQGHQMAAGVYVAEVITGTLKESIRLIKTN